MNFEKNITDKCNTTVHQCSYNFSNHTTSIHMTFIAGAGTSLTEGALPCDLLTVGVMEVRTL